jgi:hypothetical protein
MLVAAWATGVKIRVPVTTTPIVASVITFCDFNFMRKVYLVHQD